MEEYNENNNVDDVSDLPRHLHGPHIHITHTIFKHPQFSHSHNDLGGLQGDNLPSPHAQYTHLRPLDFINLEWIVKFEEDYEIKLKRYGFK